MIALEAEEGSNAIQIEEPDGCGVGDASSNEDSYKEGLDPTTVEAEIHHQKGGIQKEREHRDKDNSSEDPQLPREGMRHGSEAFHCWPILVLISEEEVSRGSLAKEDGGGFEKVECVKDDQCIPDMTMTLVTNVAGLTGGCWNFVKFLHNL